MICPGCGRPDASRVTETSLSIDDKEIIRRRVCQACGHRWKTRELAASRLQSEIPQTKRALETAARLRRLRQQPRRKPLQATS